MKGSYNNRTNFKRVKISIVVLFCFSFLKGLDILQFDPDWTLIAGYSLKALIKYKLRFRHFKSH